MDKRYTFEFLTNQSLTNHPTGGFIPTSPGGTIPTDAPTGGQNTAADGFAARAAKGVISNVVLNPLNQATGGLATPIYNVGKSILTGAGAAAIGAGVAGLVITGVMIGVRALQDRVAKLESEAKAKNEREVLLLRAGYISQVSTYDSSLIKGVYKTNRG